MSDKTYNHTKIQGTGRRHVDSWIIQRDGPSKKNARVTEMDLTSIEKSKEDQAMKKVKPLFESQHEPSKIPFRLDLLIIF